MLSKILDENFMLLSWVVGHRGQILKSNDGTPWSYLGKTGPKDVSVI